MKKAGKVAIILLVLFSVTASVACSRQPTNEKTVALMTKYFHKYSKKYPESILGQFPVSKIQLLHTSEIHKNMVAVYALLELSGGTALQTRFTMQKKSLIWKAVSWENMGIASRGQPIGQ